MRLVALHAQRLSRPHFGITHVRWAVHSTAEWRNANFGGSWIGLRLVCENMREGSWSDDGWRRFGVYLSTRWMWGVDHCYYDGPNCALWIGFLHFNSEPHECAKCEEGT